MTSIVLSIFFLMIRRPPTSTPFPTRRSSDLVEMTPRDLGVHAEQRLAQLVDDAGPAELGKRDRKSTRLNSSHVEISYAVFCLKKKKKRKPNKEIIKSVKQNSNKNKHAKNQTKSRTEIE